MSSYVLLILLNVYTVILLKYIIQTYSSNARHLKTVVAFYCIYMIVGTKQYATRYDVKNAALIYILLNLVYVNHCSCKGSSRIVSIFESDTGYYFVCVTPPSQRKEYFENVDFETFSQNRNAPLM